jgi:hypothetical protein
MEQSNDQGTDGAIRAGIRRLAMQLRGSRYWTERRDACDQIGEIARQTQFRLRQAAEDRDPDIAHCARKALAQLDADAAGHIGELTTRMDQALANDDAAVAAGTGGTTIAADAENAIASPPNFTAESLVAWLEEWAREERGHFKARPAGAQVEVPTANDRRQNVFLDHSQRDDDGRPVALFYSICGDATVEALQRALESNTRLHRGAFGVIRQGERSVLIMLLRRPLDRLWADDLPGMLRYLADKADSAEAELSAHDRH